MNKTKKVRDMSPDAPLGLGENLGFMFGAGASGILQFLFSAVLLVYYTQVVHVNPAVAASVIAVSKIFDGISDIAMGWVIEHSNSPRGKVRPWLLRAIIPTVICLLLCFWQPAGLAGTAQIVYMFVTYNLGVTVCYTVIWVSEQSLIGYMTLNAKSRSLIGGMHMIGTNIIANILVSSLYLPLSTAFGGGTPYTQKGFTMLILFYMAVYAVFTGICYLVCKERVSDAQLKAAQAASDISNTAGATKVSTTEIVKSLLTNKYVIICVLINMLVYFLMAASTTSTLTYYAQYVLGNLDLQASLTSINTLAMLVGLIATLGIVAKLGKRRTLLAGAIVLVIGYFLPLISTTTIVLTVGAVLRGIGFGLSGVPVGSILQDALTYGLWRDGFSSIGMGNATCSFANKVGTALGTAVLGFILDAGGFDGALAVQPPAAVNAISTAFIILPGIICIGIGVLAAVYDLDKKYAPMEAAIKEGKIGPHRDENLFTR